MSALGNGVVPYFPSGPGFMLSNSSPNGTGGMTHAYESNQMDYANSHPIKAVTTGGRKRRRTKGRSSRKGGSRKLGKTSKNKRRRKSYRK